MDGWMDGWMKSCGDEFQPTLITDLGSYIFRLSS